MQVLYESISCKYCLILTFYLNDIICRSANFLPHIATFLSSREHNIVLVQFMIIIAVIWMRILQCQLCSLDTNRPTSRTNPLKTTNTQKLQQYKPLHICCRVNRVTLTCHIKVYYYSRPIIGDSNTNIVQSVDWIMLFNNLIAPYLLISNEI